MRRLAGFELLWLLAAVAAIVTACQQDPDTASPDGGTSPPEPTICNCTCSCEIPCKWDEGSTFTHDCVLHCSDPPHDGGCSGSCCVSWCGQAPCCPAYSSTWGGGHVLSAQCTPE